MSTEPEIWATIEDDGIRVHFARGRGKPVASVVLNPKTAADFAVHLADKLAELRTGKGIWKLGAAVLRSMFDKE